MDFTNLDSAICNRYHRKIFLRLIKAEGFVLSGDLLAYLMHRPQERPTDSVVLRNISSPTDAG